MMARTNSLRMKSFKLKMDHFDVRLCEQGNRWLDNDSVHRFFKAISRLGDGVIWYIVMLALPVVVGVPGLIVSFLMAASAWVGVTLYSRIKHRLQRPRPFAAHPHIRAGARILDEYSFPSGHTLHAVAFMILLGSIFPWMLMILVPFAVLTGVARVVLGLHYPSDVLAGAILGAVIGSSAVWVGGFLI